MDLLTFGVQLLNGVQYGLVLFLVASGLTLVFGILGVINLAHGAFYMLGAYLAYWIAAATGSFALALVGGVAISFVLGIAAGKYIHPSDVWPRSLGAGAPQFRHDPGDRRSPPRSCSARTCIRWRHRAWLSGSIQLTDVFVVSRLPAGAVRILPADSDRHLLRHPAHPTRHGDPRRRREPRDDAFARHPVSTSLIASCSPAVSPWRHWAASSLRRFPPSSPAWATAC